MEMLEMHPMKVQLFTINTELKDLRIIIGLRKSYFYILWISVSLYHIIREEHGIHYMACSSRIINAITSHIFYHSNFGITNCCAGRITSR